MPSYKRTQFTFQSLAFGNLVETNQRGVANHIKDIGENRAAHFRITVCGEREREREREREHKHFRNIKYLIKYFRTPFLLPAKQALGGSSLID